MGLWTEYVMNEITFLGLLRGKEGEFLQSLFNSVLCNFLLNWEVSPLDSVFTDNILLHMGIMERLWNRGCKDRHGAVGHAPSAPAQGRGSHKYFCSNPTISSSNICTLQLAENPQHGVFASEAAKTRDAKWGREAWWSPWANPDRAVASAPRPPAPGTALGPLLGSDPHVTCLAEHRGPQGQGLPWLQS